MRRMLIWLGSGEELEKGSDMSTSDARRLEGPAASEFGKETLAMPHRSFRRCAVVIVVTDPLRTGPCFGRRVGVYGATRRLRRTYDGRDSSSAQIQRGKLAMQITFHSALIMGSSRGIGGAIAINWRKKAPRNWDPMSGYGPSPKSVTTQEPGLSLQVELPT